MVWLGPTSQKGLAWELGGDEIQDRVDRFDPAEEEIAPPRHTNYGYSGLSQRERSLAGGRRYERTTPRYGRMETQVERLARTRKLAEQQDPARRVNPLDIGSDFGADDCPGSAPMEHSESIFSLSVFRLILTTEELPHGT